MIGVIVAILALVFAAAAIGKIRAPELFQAHLRKLVPAALVSAAAAAVPAAELGLAAWLASGIETRAAVAVSAALLVFFTLVLLKMWRIGLEGCGCFGEEASGGGIWSAIARNLTLFCAAVLVICSKKDRQMSVNGVENRLGQATVILGMICLWVCLSAITRRWKWIGRRSMMA